MLYVQLNLFEIKTPEDTNNSIDMIKVVVDSDYIRLFADGDCKISQNRELDLDAYYHRREIEDEFIQCHQDLITDSTVWKTVLH